MLLIGDIGGTNARFCFVREKAFESSKNGKVVLPSGSYPDAVSLFREVLELQEASDRPRFAVVALAGRVHNDRCETTNLPWTVNAREIEKELGLERMRLLNDLEAAALGLRGLDSLPTEDLQTGQQRIGNRALLAAGTGLGEAGLVRDGDGFHAFATEGGHCTFAARTDLECDLRSYTQKELGGHVSWERFVSGPGLVRLHRFMHEVDGVGIPDWLLPEHVGRDTPEIISRAALDASCDRSVRTLELFCSLYGAEAGNLALKLLAEGGVFLGGGLANDILPFLQKSSFCEAFCDKGRFSEWMATLPIRVVVEEDLALRGAMMQSKTLLENV